ncbi:hypothetical protein FXO38_09842 [Capsicum annuum]|nr:hypothetical protein FXO37_25879 [Capsicum annuum]KAF3664977.1 hypothetical protein FXO38_09842 [Capsicum annuum]
MVSTSVQSQVSYPRVLSLKPGVQNTAEVADLIHSTQDDELLEKQKPLVTGSPILDKMDSSVVTSKSSSKTIFSPTLESLGAYNDSDIPSDRETLVHSILEHCDDSDFTFLIFFSMKEHVVYVNQRPHLWTFLERVAEIFEVVIFTTSQSIYTKDLTVLGVDVAKVAILDNSPQVQLIRERLKVAQSRQKLYAYVRRKSLEFEVGDLEKCDSAIMVHHGAGQFLICQFSVGLRYHEALWRWPKWHPQTYRDGGVLHRLSRSQLSLFQWLGVMVAHHAKDKNRDGPDAQFSDRT